MLYIYTIYNFEWKEWANFCFKKCIDDDLVRCAMKGPRNLSIRGMRDDQTLHP